MNEEVKYQRPESCNECGGLNNAIHSGSFNEGEMETECDDCGHTDMWCYGRFESGEYMVGKARHYVNRGGRLINVEE